MKRLVLSALLLTGCGSSTEKIEYRCPSDADACEEKVPGVRRYERGPCSGPSMYWVPCNRVKSTKDRALCRKAGY